MKQDNVLDESTFSFIISRSDGSFKPDRIIISHSLSYPKIITVKIVGNELVSYFSNLFDLDLSVSVDPNIANQIIGAYSVFKITPEMYDSITKNKDLSDMNVVIDSSKQVYGIIKRFLLSNPENFQKTLNEAIAYIDTYIKTQLSKYNISDDMFLSDPKQTTFILFIGKQKQYESDALSSLIKNQYDNKVPEVQKPPVVETKKGFFASIFGKKEPKEKIKDVKITQKNLEKQQKQIKSKEEADLEREIKELEKSINSEPKHKGILALSFQHWKEKEFEPLEKRNQRLELEHKEAQYKLDIARQKLDLIKKKKELKEKISNSSNVNNTNNQQSNNEEEEQ